MTPLIHWWQSRGRRERTALSVLAIFLVGTLLIQFLFVPLLASAHALQARIAIEEARLARMRAQASEITELARAPAKRISPDLGERAAAAFAPLAAPGRPTVEATEGAGTRIRLDAAPFDGVLGVLEPLLRESGVQVSEFSAAGLGTSGMVRVEMSLRP